MLRFLTFLCLVLSLEIIAQDSTAQRSKWSIGLNVSPGIAYRDLKVVDASMAPPELIRFRNDMEIPRFGVSVAIMAAYSFNDRFELEAGCGYTSHGWAMEYEDRLFIARDPNDPAIPSSYEPIRQEFHYLDFPIRGMITFGKGRWCSISSIGGSLNLLQRAAFVSIINGERRSVEHDYFEDLNFTVIASTGIAFKPEGRSEFRLEPTFRYALLPIIDAPITGYLWSAGVNFGWYRSF